VEETTRLHAARKKQLENLQANYWTAALQLYLFNVEHNSLVMYLGLQAV
jgi:hypothetical protein